MNLKKSNKYIYRFLHWSIEMDQILHRPVRVEKCFIIMRGAWFVFLVFLWWWTLGLLYIYWHTLTCKEHVRENLWILLTQFRNNRARKFHIYKFEKTLFKVIIISLLSDKCFLIDKHWLFDKFCEFLTVFFVIVCKMFRKSL